MDPKIECQCCWFDVPLRDLASCSVSANHVFCHRCIRQYVSTELGKRNTDFKCISGTQCSGRLVHKDRRTILGDELSDNIDRVEQSSIATAGIDNLYHCPMCASFAAIYIPEDDGPVFWCQNPMCRIPTCSMCKLEAHWDTDCQRDEYTERRKQREEDKTMQVVKKCPSCQVEINKDGGCNKVDCVCGKAMCWQCERVIPMRDHSHFTERGATCSLFPDDGPYTYDDDRSRRRHERAQRPARQHRRDGHPARPPIVAYPGYGPDHHVVEANEATWRLHEYQTRLTPVDERRVMMERPTRQVEERQFYNYNPPPMVQPGFTLPNPSYRTIYPNINLLYSPDPFFDMNSFIRPRQ
jgi:hypothetical protein